MPATDHRRVFLGVVRRTSLRRALAGDAQPEPEAELTGVAIDLADLYWQTTAGLLLGTPSGERED